LIVTPKYKLDGCEKEICQGSIKLKKGSPMSSSSIAISVDSISKCYEIYDSPRDRLKQFLVPRMRSFIGMSPRVYYREFWALKDVSFEVKKGESVGIIGRNGCGKSTLLQLITGTLSPTSGAVSTEGKIAALLELGAGFNPDFTGRENVYMNGALLGLPQKKIDEKFDAIASFADIGLHLDQPVKTYSSGMLVRLAFAVQVQIEPDILIIDEALAVGDALFQKRCFQRIEKLLCDGTTLLFVSHDQESVRTLTQRSLLLNKGKALFWGNTADVVLEYRRLLHEEETAYFAKVVKDLSECSKENRQENISIAAPAKINSIDEMVSDSADLASGVRSDQLSFGDGNVQIICVETLDKNNEACSAYYPGDSLRIRITCESKQDISRLNVAVRLRNKEGIKIYSWGTLNQDMEIISSHVRSPLFWSREFKLGDRFQVVLECPCNLGVNLYEVQAAVTFEQTPDYMSQRMLHWLDEAAFFHVHMKRDEYFFGGVVDLRMSASW